MRMHCKREQEWRSRPTQTQSPQSVATNESPTHHHCGFHWELKTFTEKCSRGDSTACTVISTLCTVYVRAASWQYHQLYEAVPADDTAPRLHTTLTSLTQSFQRVLLRFEVWCLSRDDDDAGASPWTGIASIVADVVQFAESLGACVAADTKFILNCAYM